MRSNLSPVLSSLGGLGEINDFRDSAAGTVAQLNLGDGWAHNMLSTVVLSNLKLLCKAVNGMWLWR